MEKIIYEQVDDLKKIKKDYGENMSHMCRELFPTILEHPGLLYHILSTHFAKAKSLYGDITREGKKYQFKEYIYYFYDEIKEKKENEKKEAKFVKELLEEKGYDIYECKTNEDIHKFRKYYKDNEALCTFTDPNRIDNHYIFFIVKKNVEEIKRENFTNPQREDEYSTSVLDLQFDKGTRQRVSIKSRYNHTVSSPDATYSNNLEMIAPGLTEAFEREYGFNIGNEYKVNFELDGYVKARDNKYYKYNYEINNVHYCPNNIIIDNGNIIEDYKDKSRYTFMDYFILDESKKEIIIYDKEINDSFIDALKPITNIEITNKEGYKEVKLTIDQNKEAIIKLDSNGKIIGYENKYLEECGNDFLRYNKSLQELNLPNLKVCGYCFFYCNNELKEIYLPNLQECGDSFLERNRSLQKLNLPNLQECGDSFLLVNDSLQELSLPNLQECGSYFLNYNESLQELNLPKLEECGKCFLGWNKSLQKPNLPNLQECGDSFLESNKFLQKLNLPNLIKCGNNFLGWNKSLQKLNLPNLQECGSYFLNYNESLQELNLPNLQECGSYFLNYNESLQELSLPNLIKCGNNFLGWNKSLQKLNLPNLQECGSYFLNYNESLQELIQNNVLTIESTGEKKI